MTDAEFDKLALAMASLASARTTRTHETAATLIAHARKCRAALRSLQGGVHSRNCGPERVPDCAETQIRRLPDAA